MSRILSSLALFALLASCATGPAPTPIATPAVTQAAPALTGGAADSLKRMKDFLAAGLDRLDQGLIADGIKQLVSVLSEGQQIASPSQEANDIASKAETELSKLASALALEPDTAWLDPAGNQASGDTMNPRMPSVILTIKQSGGRSVVSNAPVQFAFVRGAGALTAMVNTNDTGQANCTITSFDNPAAEQSVRASLVFKVRGYTREFKGVERDFVYAPPSRRATLLVLERSRLGVSSDPFVVNPVFQELKAVRYDWSLFNGSLSPDAFLRVYEGDPASIASIGLDKNVSYLAVVLNDCTGIRQLELGGRKYNLFVSDARATLRLLRKADGKIVYQTSVERAHAKGTHGQGGTEQKAAEDVLRSSSADLAAAVKKDVPVISAALDGK